ncbi:MAG: hypothetical protein HQL43_00510 [Alphaproteobacteria bacterium]|nr:hypothetical protein [Alphaproteobacteria bacterium]
MERTLLSSHPMKLTFLIHSTPSYRTLGPIIEEAARRSNVAINIILGPDFEPGRLKSYQSASFENIPERLRGLCQIVKPSTTDEYIDAFCQADAVLALSGYDYELKIFSQLLGPPTSKNLSPAPSACWAIVTDSFIINDIEHSDLVFWTGSHCESYSSSQKKDDVSGIRDKLLPVGYVRADVVNSINREALRTQLGIASGQPCVLYVPDSFLTRMDPTLTTPWFRHYWCAASRLSRIKGTLRHLRHPYWLLRASFERLGHVKTLSSLRRFCNANGAFLLFAPRRVKDTPSGKIYLPDEEAIADGFVPPCETYPQAMIHGLIACDLAVCSYRSGTILDAAAIGRPMITVAAPQDGFSKEVVRTNAWYDRNYAGNGGFHWLMEASEFIHEFPKKQLKDFRLDPKTLEHFRELHTGPADGQSSRRLLNKLQEFLLKRAI